LAEFDPQHEISRAKVPSRNNGMQHHRESGAHFFNQLEVSTARLNTIMMIDSAGGGPLG